MRATLWTDGGARGNPGPAAFAYVLESEDGTVLDAHGEAIGVATNNVAEYSALVAGLRRAAAVGVQELEVRSDKLPAGSGSGAKAELARQPLPELVEHFLSEAARDRALVIDVESAREFRLANAEAVSARVQGDQSRWCPLCLAVRRGMEADFAWKAGELGALSPAQEKEAVELASMRDEVRRKWAGALVSELNDAQLCWLREAQMRWLKSALHDAVATGMRSLGPEKCEASATKVEWKCELCSIVLRAVDEAKSRS